MISYDVLGSEATNVLLLLGQAPELTIRDHILTLNLESVLLNLLWESVLSCCQVLYSPVRMIDLPCSAVFCLTNNILTARSPVLSCWFESYRCTI